MIFEFLTGGLPLGLAAVVGLTYFAVARSERSIRYVVLCASIYLLAAGAAVITKLVAVAAVFGPQAVWKIGGAAAERVNGLVDPAFGNRTLFSAIFDNMDALGPGLGAFNFTILLIALVGGYWTLRRYWRRPEILLLALSNLPVILWPLLFQQHMMIHAWFMDRIFAWSIASGFALFVVGAIHSRENSDNHVDRITPHGPYRTG